MWKILIYQNYSNYVQAMKQIWNALQTTRSLFGFNHKMFYCITHFQCKPRVFHMNPMKSGDPYLENLFLSVWNTRRAFKFENIQKISVWSASSQPSSCCATRHERTSEPPFSNSRKWVQFSLKFSVLFYSFTQPILILNCWKHVEIEGCKK